MRGLLLLPLWIASFGVFAENDAAQLNIAQAAYCVCMCCEGDTGVCKRPDILPLDFMCDMSRCNQNLCQNWKQAKCRKDCYCMKCKSVLSINDYRCVTFKPEGISDDCTCPDLNEIKCQTGQESMPQAEFDKLKLQAGDLASKFAKASSIPKPCFTHCYCDKCIDNFTDSMRAQCEENKNEKIGADCSCSDMDDVLQCPDIEVVKDFEAKLPELKKMEADSLKSAEAEMEGWEEHLTLAKKLSQDLRTPESQEKLKVARCDLSCFCQKCQPALGELVEEKCAGMEIAKDCDCTKSEADIDCDKFKSDMNCNMGCMCKVCAADIALLAKGGVDTFGNVCKAHADEKKMTFCDCKNTDCSMFQLSDDLKKLVTDTDGADKVKFVPTDEEKKTFKPPLPRSEL